MPADLGEDYFELVERVERVFSVPIPWANALELHTVGAMYRYLAARLESTDACATSHAFYRVRRALTGLLRLPREAVRPGTVLEGILPARRGERKLLWRRLERRLSLDALPRLRWPAAEQTGAGLGCATVCIGGALWANSLPVGPKVVGAGVALCLASAAAARALAYDPPFATAGDLARGALELWVARDPAPRPWARRELWSMVRHIVADELGVAREDVVPEARWVEDFQIY